MRFLKDGMTVVRGFTRNVTARPLGSPAVVRQAT